MRMLVESLRRLYVAGKISADKIFELADYGKITSEELNYILEGENA